MTTYRFDPRLPFASTLPSSYYTDASILEAEQRKVFGTTWQLVGRAGQVSEPGAFFTASVAGEPLLIVRGADSALRVLSNVCRHRAGPVAKGEGKRNVLPCGYHGWTYGLDGRLLKTPEMEGVECFDRDAMSLPQFRVETWNDLVFVNLSSGAPSLRDFLGDLADVRFEGDLAARKEWYLDCNWKVYVDNYLEGYHIPVVHPGLFREIDYPNYRTETRLHYSIQHAPLKHRNAEAAYYWVYPNLMLNVYPDNFSTNLIVPIGHERTLTIFEWYFRDPSPAAVDATVKFSDEIQIEDIEICEAVQRGLRSATYSTGRYSPVRENGVHHFHGLYARDMDLMRA